MTTAKPTQDNAWGDAWGEATHRLASGEARLVGLWADGAEARMALSAGRPELEFFHYATVDGSFPSVGATHAPAIRLERAIADLSGLKARGAPDPRPWLDHGRWPLAHPLAGGAPTSGGGPERYAFLGAEGVGLHQIPVGPVHAGIIEPGHFRFHASGETIVRLEARLGYVHKGVEHLMAGADLTRGAQLAARVSGDSTVAYQIAFARAVEAASGIVAPPRAAWLRALMAEIERVANHLGDIGAICNDASFSLMHAHTGALRELTLRAADIAFGHRLMMDCVTPGGVLVDLDRDRRTALRELTTTIRDKFPRLVELYDNTASLQDRTVGTGRLDPELALRFGCGGVIGRASGRDFDARRDHSYSPYDELRFDTPVWREGDVNARVWVRIREVEESVRLIGQILDRLPVGPIRAEREPARRAGEGWALVEGFRGDVFVYVRLGDDGRIARCHLRDPSWFQWPLLEAAIEGNIVADFPLCNKSFNCSYSGHDL
ncbi:MAG: hydrogenase expression protein HypE [Roseiarcus sp.]|jgi:Ni,Fe-hydrogenase III large subunit